MFRLSDILHPLNVLGSAPAVLGNTTVVRFSVVDPTISITCTGEIKVRSTKSGYPVEATYSNLPTTLVSVQADANTDITIIGDVTGFGFGILGASDPNYYWSNNTALQTLGVYYCTEITSLDISAHTALEQFLCNGCTGLTSLDLSANTALQLCVCSECTGLTTLDLSANTALTDFYCIDCTGLTLLDLSTNTALTYLDCSNCSALTAIKYPATNNYVSTAVAQAITNALAADGTVYTDSAAAYYSTIATAANNKGWTIAQL